MSASRTNSARRARTGPIPVAHIDKAAIDRIVETAIWLQAESRRLAKEQCAKHGITATQLNALKLLQSVGDLSLSDLSKKMSATNSAITGLVDRMVEAGLVAREQSAEDRRVWKIRLTAEGKAMARKVDVAPWEILSSALLALPPAELEQLIKTLLKVTERIEGVIEARRSE